MIFDTQWSRWVSIATFSSTRNDQKKRQKMTDFLKALKTQKNEFSSLLTCFNHLLGQSETFSTSTSLIFFINWWIENFQYFLFKVMHNFIRKIRSIKHLWLILFILLVITFATLKKSSSLQQWQSLKKLDFLKIWNHNFYGKETNMTNLPKIIKKWLIMTTIFFWLTEKAYLSLKRDCWSLWVEWTQRFSLLNNKKSQN